MPLEPSDREWRAGEHAGLSAATDALRESEERFRRLFEGHAAAKLVLDPADGRIVDANAAAARFYGWSVDELRRMRIQEINTLTAGEVAAAMSSAAAQQRTSFEFRHRRADGSVRDVEAFSSAVEIKGRTLLYSIIHDITDRKLAEAERERLAAQNRQLQKAESLGRMAGAVAHLFNNQLQVVLGCLDMALDTLPPDGPVRDWLTDAMQASARAVEVSTLMLTYLGLVAVTRRPLNLAEFCERRLPLWRSQLPEGVALEAALAWPGPTVLADAGQLEQLLTNLLANAGEAVAGERGAVTLSVREVAADALPELNRFPVDYQPHGAHYACVELADDGLGVAEADVERLFDPFYSTKFTGRGLGLPVVLGIVRAHDGAIVVTSEPGRGSVFAVYLPVTVGA